MQLHVVSIIVAKLVCIGTHTHNQLVLIYYRCVEMLLGVTQRNSD